jgi:quercetin dioxygenase-like cupin family protein
VYASSFVNGLEENSLNDPKKRKQAQEFPKVIKDLPEADLPFNGVRAWILQGEKQQLIFFEMESIAIVPEHSHTYPQWGMVIHGQMKLTVDNKTRLYRKGDEYLIPAQAKHSATFPTKARVMDFFQEKTRYKTKHDIC